MTRVRRLDESEWEAYRQIRLAALAEAPDAFGSTLAEARSRTDAQWVAFHHNRVTFVAVDAEALVGMVSGIASERPGRAELISMWVAPSHRRSGVGARLVSAVLTWARGEGYREVRLDVVDRNLGARRLYQRLGFRPTGRREPYPNAPPGEEIELRLTLRPPSDK